MCDMTDIITASRNAFIECIDLKRSQSDMTAARYASEFWSGAFEIVVNCYNNKRLTSKEARNTFHRLLIDVKGLRSQLDLESDCPIRKTLHLVEISYREALS